MYAHIETIEDVLPHVVDNKGIFVAYHQDFTVIDYAYISEETFDSPMALECRGLKFATNGRILARPFHKFFNIGERERPEAIDFSRPHVVLDKLDGSMVHPVLIEGDLVFMTRKGVSKEAMWALGAAGDNVKALSVDLLERGLTPIFEFTSPDNRIVVAYDAPRVTLLGVRHVNTGAYHSHGALEALADDYGVPLVAARGHVGDVDGFIDAARGLTGAEGYVVMFEDGHRLKVKADAYVLRHKALAGASHEKHVLAWILEDALDDVVPLLPQAVAARTIAYRDALWANLGAHQAELEAFVAANRHRQRAEFAQAVKAAIDPRLQRIAYALLDGRDARDELMRILSRAAQSENRIETIRDILGVAWHAVDLTGDGV